MTEREIFVEAHQEPDPGARRAILDRECGADRALRDRIEALLLKAAEAGEFLEPNPAGAHPAHDPALTAAGTTPKPEPFSRWRDHTGVAAGIGRPPLARAPACAPGALHRPAGRVANRQSRRTDMRPRTFRTALALVSLAVTGWAAPAAAVERPHTLKGTGQFVSASEFVGRGTATHLGKFTELGSAAFIPTDDPAVFHIEGWAIHTAANGDEVHEVISGQVNLLTGAGTATVVYVGGTGRFTGASGTAGLTLQLLPGGAYEFAGEGTIDY